MNVLLDAMNQVMEERDRVLEKKDTLERLHIEEQQKFQEEYEEMGRFIKEQNDALEVRLLLSKKRRLFYPWLHPAVRLDGNFCC